MMPDFEVKFKSSGRGKAQCPANPEFPDGVDIAVAADGPTCKVALPYPAPECGAWLLRCRRCGVQVGVTAAGRADDPRSVVIPCKAVVQ